MKKILLLLLLCFQLIPSKAQTWDEIIKLYGSAEAAGDNRFGKSVSISGDKAIVGAFFNDDFGYLSGTAYIFELVEDTWTEVQQIGASDSEELLRFGTSVSISGDKAIIGAIEEDEQGSAYIFELVEDTWVETQKLIASDASPGGHFGSSVCMNGDKAVIGAYTERAAYIFDLEGDIWVETQKIIPSDLDEALGSFGYSVSMDGNKIIVGSTSSYGSAYIFELIGDTWTEMQKLTASDEDFNEKFGFTVDISGDIAIIGAHGDDGEAGLFSGSAYIFELEGDTWVEAQKLTAHDAELFSSFGFSVSISGDRLIIGSPEDDDNGSVSGSAYIFERVEGTWTETQKLIASDGTSSDIFGWSVSIDDQSIIIGAPKDSDLTFHAGSAYIFMDLDGEGLSISENKEVTAIAYPNPTLGNMTLQMNGYFQYEIVDSFGKIVMKGEGYDYEHIDTQNLSIGIYVLSVTNAGEMKSMRIVKQ